MPDKSFLAWPFFEDRHRVLAAAIEEWCRSNLPVAHRRCRCRLPRTRGEARSRRLARAFRDRPRSRAARSTCARSASIRETLARHDGLADFAFAMQGLGAGAISLFGTAAQRQWLKRTRAGTAIAAFALSEPGSGSDVASIEMTARRDGGDYILDGEKTWISNGGIADFYVVFARTGEAPGAKGLSAFIVPADLAGFSIAERIDGDRAASACTHQVRGGARAGVGDDRKAGRGLQDRHGDARCLPHDGRGGRARLRPPGARRDDRARPRRADCSARRCPTCRWCRRTSPTWRSTSMRRRCWSTAPPGPRTGRRTRHPRGRDGEAVRHRSRAGGDRQGGADPRRRRRSPRAHRGTSLSRNPGAAHLRRRVRGPEGRHRATDTLRRMIMLGPTAHIDTFARDNLPPLEQWPELAARSLRLSGGAQRRGRADRPHGRARVRRSRRADRQRPPAHLQGALRLDEPHRPRAGRGLRHQARQPDSGPLRQQSGHGRVLARGDQGRCRGREHDADAARGRARQDRRQGRDRPCALRHAVDGRARRLRARTAAS